MQPGILFKRLLKLLKRFMQQDKPTFMGSNKQRGSPNILRSNTPPKNPHLWEYAKRYEGKLLLRDEIPLSHFSFQHLLANHYFQSITSISKKGSHSHCTRCQNDRPHLFASIPCARCNKTHLYCRNCIHMGRVMACEPLYRWNGLPYEWEKHITPCTWLGKLTHAQQLGADEVKRAVVERKHLIIWAVTGAGKTEMLYPAISLALEKGLRICIASPRADVVRELLPRFRAAFGDVFIQGLYGGSHDNDGTAQLILATTHQLFRYDRAFDVVIIDEVDAFPYHRDALLQLAVHRASKAGVAAIHLTATPRDAQLKQITSKKAAVIFVPIRFHGHPLIVPTWKIVPQIKKAIINEEVPPPVLSSLKNRQRRTRQLLVFVPTISIAKKLEAPLGELLMKLGDIDSLEQVTNVHAGDEEREHKVVAFRKKHLYALITTTILERGVTFPAIDVMVLDAGHEVFDEAALIQISGRAGRSPKDPTGEVLFIHDGLTDAMVKANEGIIQMNNRRRKMLQRSKKA